MHAYIHVCVCIFIDIERDKAKREETSYKKIFFVNYYHLCYLVILVFFLNQVFEKSYRYYCNKGKNIQLVYNILWLTFSMALDRMLCQEVLVQSYILYIN